MAGYVDKQSLIELSENTENDEMRYILNYILTSYHFDEWQTIEEFKANPANGWHYICYVTETNNKYVNIAFYSKSKNVFYWIDMVTPKVDDFNNVRNITHVMSIRTPDEPK